MVKLKVDKRKKKTSDVMVTDSYKACQETDHPYWGSLTSDFKVVFVQSTYIYMPTITIHTNFSIPQNPI